MNFKINNTKQFRVPMPSRLILNTTIFKYFLKKFTKLNKCDKIIVNAFAGYIEFVCPRLNLMYHSRPTGLSWYIRLSLGQTNCDVPL